MLCPPRWACLRSCLPPCLPSGLGCCVRLAGLVFLLSAVLSPVLSPVLSAIFAGMLCPPRWAVSGLVSQLVSHLSGMLCPPPWSCLSLVSGLVSQLLSLFCLVACLSSGMLCLPPLGLSFSCLWSCPPACLGCCVRLLGSSPSPACLRSFCPILFSSWSGVSVLWACLQNFMCDLCNCLGSTVVYFWFLGVESWGRVWFRGAVQIIPKANPVAEFGLLQCQEFSLLGQWLNFKLFGITYLVGKIKFKLFSPNSLLLGFSMLS